MDSDDNGKKEGNTIFNGFSPKCGLILAISIAELLSEGLDSDQISTLGGFVTTIGDALAYIAAQKELNEELASKLK